MLLPAERKEVVGREKRVCREEQKKRHAIVSRQRLSVCSTESYRTAKPSMKERRLMVQVEGRLTRDFQGRDSQEFDCVESLNPESFTH